MKTKTLRKLVSIALSVMMIVGLCASMTVSAADPLPTIEGRKYGEAATTTLGASDWDVDAATGAKFIAVWGYNGITALKPLTSASNAIAVDPANKQITVTLNETITGLESDKWVKGDTEGLSIGFTDKAIDDKTDPEEYVVFYGLKADGNFRKIKLTSTQDWEVKIVGVDKKDLAQAIAEDYTKGNTSMSKFWGYNVIVEIAGTEYAYTDKKTTLEDGKTIVITAEFKDADRVVIRAVGPNMHPNQKIFTDGAGLKAGKSCEFYKVGAGGIVDGTCTPIIVKGQGPAGAAPAPAYTGTFDQKMDPTGLLNDMKISLTGGTNVWVNVDKKTTEPLEKHGYTAVLVAGNDVTSLSINTYNDLNPSISIKVPAGTLTKEITFDVTSSDQTFIVPLTDGTFTFLNVKLHNNYDYIAPLTRADITGFRLGINEFTEMVTLDSSSITGENKTLFFDTIMARAGQMNIFYTADTYDFDTNGDGEKDKNDQNFKGWVDLNNTSKADYAKLVSNLSFRGFNNLNDPAGGTLKPAVPGRLKNVSEFYSTDTLKQEDVYGRVSRLTYNFGGEEVTMLIYPFGSHRTFEIAYDGNTYVYSMVFNGKHAEMDVTAIGLGVEQAVKAELSDRGEYIYDFGGTNKFRPDSVPKKSDLVGYGIGALKKTEVPAEITITNYTKDQKDYGKTGTVLSFRAPQGTVVTVGEGDGCYATVLDRATGKIGYTGDDGLVDYFVKINYSTIGTSKFTMKLTYADGSYREFVVKSTFETDTKKFPTITLPSSIVPTALVTFPNPTPLPEPTEPTEKPTVKPTEKPTEKPTTPTTAVHTGADDTETDVPGMGNAFNAIAYIITIGAAAIGGVSTLVIRKKK